jgi:hypothetical protein
MKKFLKLPIFAMLLALLSFEACQKESNIPTSNAPQTTLSQTNKTITEQNAETEASPEATAIYTHNGEVISFESLNNFEDDNIEVYSGYSQNPNELLVFFNSDEVNAWLEGAPENMKKAIQKNREYTRSAREIAISTGAVKHFEQTGKILPEYQVQLDRLGERLFGNLGGSRGLGVLYQFVNYSGSSLPVLGTGLGYPILWGLDRNLNSLKTVSITALHYFTTKQFYFGRTLTVSGHTSSAWTWAGGWVPVLGAASSFTVQFWGVLSDWGTQSPTGNKIRTYRGMGGILG